MINGTDQNSAYKSLQNALVPAANLIDGRSEEDMLCFLANFASVINFYNQDNRLEGSWAPFLLKDPVFLTAMISRTNAKEEYALFVSNAKTLDKCLMHAVTGNPTYDHDLIDLLFNRLFGQIDRVYQHFRSWIFYMEKSHFQYEFKRYLTTNIQNHYSQYFWALMSMKEAMHLKPIIPGVTMPFDHAGEIANYAEQKIWETGMDKAPYWEVLGMDGEIIDGISPIQILEVLRRNSEIIFDFFERCISYAAREYDYLKQKKSVYPDTLLLRSFVGLLQKHQRQLNSISRKHLDYYYRDILLQEPLPASPDSAYLTAALGKPDVMFTLPANTLFNAGTDSLKNPIVFSNPATVQLNPGVLTNITTLSVSDGNGIYLNTMPTPGAVRKDQQGNIIGFNTFGDTTNQGTLVTTGIAFASPMFLLKEGARTITLTITCTEAINKAILNGASYYFSTITDWLQVKLVQAPAIVDLPNVITLTFKLDATQPPIEPFKKNPDLLETTWPLFKMQFQSLPDPAQPPVIEKLQIDVYADGIKGLQLYNDYGALSTKAAFPFMGPSPMPGANFFVGSSEIFSKPVKTFSLEIDWNGLPANFAAYYQLYNQYLNGDMNIPDPVKPCLLTRVKNFFTGNKVDDSPKSNPFKLYFNNCCFTTTFQVLQQQKWVDLNIQNTEKCTMPPTHTKANADASGRVKNPNHNMFSVTDGKLSPKSVYQFFPGGEVFVPDVSLQSTPLKYTGQNVSGFLKMTLGGLVNGFGALLYPDIVFLITLDNARLIADSDPPAFTTPVPKPFVPKVSSVSATYGATSIMNFTAPDSTYPLQCFLYTPFQNYKVFDASSGITKYNYKYVGSVTSNGIPMFPPIGSNGYLFIGIDKLYAPGSLSLYFELARVYAHHVNNYAVTYSYLSTSGWKSLNPLADGTNNFSCSGIIKMDIPADIDFNGLQNQPGKCCLAISVQAPPLSYAQTVFCATNGFVAHRTTPQQGTSLTHIAASAISKTMSAVPQLSTISQPFPSFGGKVAETGTQMNLRVSNRMKTKDRAASSDDFFRIIVQSFPEVFYAKMVCNAEAGISYVYLVKAFANARIAGAFTPMMTACAEEKIRQFLVAKSSPFISIAVLNFSLQYVKVTADLVVSEGHSPDEIALSVNQQLNVFLSPWISSNDSQVTIGNAITAAQVSRFLAGLPGVLLVKEVLLQSWTDFAPNPRDYTTAVLSPKDPSVLLVSALDHSINCTTS
jgi:hypothetical protein